MHLFPVVLRRGTDFIHGMLEPFGQDVPVQQIVILQYNGEFIAADTEHGAVLKYAADQPARCLQVDVSLLMAVFVVDLLEVVTVKYTDGKCRLLPVLIVQLTLHLVEIGVIGTLVPDGSQGVDISPLIQVEDMVLHVTGQTLKRPCEPSDFIIPVIIQREIIITHVHLVRCFGQFFQRPCNSSGIKHRKNARGHKHSPGQDQDIPDQPLPVSLCFRDRHGHVQAHPVAERQPRGNLVNPVIIVFNEGVLGNRLGWKLRLLFLGQPADINPRMIEQISFLIAQKCVAIVVKTYAVHLLGHSRIVDLDPDHTDKLSPPVNRDII